MSNYYEELVSLFNQYLAGVNSKLDSVSMISGFSLLVSVITLIIVIANSRNNK